MPMIFKGSKVQTETIRKVCRGVVEDNLKLRLNMDNTKITHVNDGFIFLSHRIIRKRNHYGEMRVISALPKENAALLTALLSGNYSENKVNMAEQLNRKLKGLAMF